MEMSRPYYDQYFKNYNSVRLMQMYRWLFLVGAISSGNFANSLETRDTVFVNFHRRYNVSKLAVFHNDGYLPPVVPDFSLPEVIDNKVRNVVIPMNESKSYPNVLYLPERDSLRHLATRKGLQNARHPGISLLAVQNHRRPSLLQDMQSQTTAQPFSHEAGISVSSSFMDRISIEEMSCQNAGGELFFRASVKAPKNSSPPVVDNVISELCRAIVIKDSYRINFEKDQFWNCGVIDCSTDGNQSYCLDLRFPVISGLRLKDDYRVTLRCKTQDRIAYHTKRISVKTLEAKGRSVPSVLNGGFKSALNVDVGLFRKTYGSENIFDKRIQSGGTVVLGEEILLRVLINGDDGWRYSKIGQVTVHYVEKKQQQNVVNSLWILDKEGCLNSDVREICPREQYAASSLENYLIFQAFMFDNMKETDEIFLTVKATACLEATDCILDCPAGHVRHARSISDRNNTAEWEDDIALRVILPKYELYVSQNSILPIFLSIIVLFTLIALVWFVKILFHQRLTKPNNFR